MKYKRMSKTMAGTIAVSVVASSLQAAPKKETPMKWFIDGQVSLNQSKHLRDINSRAKNVIFFVGDGMGVSTVTAARILEGQLNGGNGEENMLSFEKMPNLALSKTYNTNQQTPDSAGTMSAMMTGVKTKAGVISVNQNAIRGDYTSVAGNRLVTLLEIAEMTRKSTGIISTARLTHATPACCYAHSPERNWESDDNLPPEAVAADFPDIARQLIEFPYGDGLEVALGGGRRHFLPKTFVDGEGKSGKRLDGRNLTDEWVENYPKSAYVWNEEQFNAINPRKVDHLLGLFESSHMQYEYDRSSDTAGEPSLSEMTAKAIQVLDKNRNGYFLHVESGRIDHAHHASNAFRALTDAIELAHAVKTAMDMTNPRDTLIVVTADHSHVFTIGGYPTRGNDILGKVVSNDNAGFPADEYSKDALGLPYTTVSYANGPGYTGASAEQAEGAKSYPHFGTAYTGITAGRPDLTDIDTTSPSFMQESTVPMSSETHAAEDVAIYARGPKAHLFHGTQEQNYIFHVMLEALYR
jgi:alkaline phosphatase